MTVDLPSDPSQLTPDAARNAEACDQTDLLCLRIMGVPSRRWSYDQPKMGGRDSQIRVQYRVSRTPEGAYRAREWLRETIDPSQFDADAVEYTDVEVSVSRYDAALCAQAFGEDYNFHEIVSLYPNHSGDEALNAARLLLLLAAEGVIEIEEGA